MTALTSPSNSTGSTMTLRGSASNERRADRDGVGGHVGEQHAPLLDGALADQALAERERLAGGRRVARRRSAASSFSCGAARRVSIW